MSSSFTMKKISLDLPGQPYPGGWMKRGIVGMIYTKTDMVLDFSENESLVAGIPGLLEILMGVEFR